VTFGFCDDRADRGFSWIVREPMARASHALQADGRVWLVDPVDWPEALARASALGELIAVIQLLDRHSRDCARTADRLRIPHLRVPAAIPGSPFEVVPIKTRRWWREIALWWPAERTLVVADAIGTNAFMTGGSGTAGVHPLLRLTPPRRQLGRFEPEHLLVGHGEGLHGPAATQGLHAALRDARRGLPRVLAKLPWYGSGKQPS
jgi:hypothetical protein